MNNNSIFKKAFTDSLPVLTGYLCLGLGFGILMEARGYGLAYIIPLSLFAFTGSGQYLAAGLMASDVSLLGCAITIFAVNARYLLYGFSMLDDYKDIKYKPLMIFWLTDETYALVNNEKTLPKKQHHQYAFYLSALDHSYWLIGTIAGGIIGGLFSFNTDGIDFVMTALFLTIFTEQWLSAKNHLPAIIGIICSLIATIIFKGNMVIPSMIAIIFILIITRNLEVMNND